MNQSVLATERSGRALTFVRGDMLQSRYRIGRQLGAGGMGAVYEAVDVRLQVTVAVKETFAVDNRLRRQFEQEAQLLAQLNHPALPRVSDYFTEDGRAFLVMQFIAGDDLAQVISERRKAFPPEQVIAWADQLLDALIYLHTRDRQIVHRDIKPHNLKITETGQVSLLDFGLAKAHAADNSTSHSAHSLFGYTRRYSPLEQMQDQGTSPQSDIYALGATLFHLLTGEKPPDAFLRAALVAEGKRDPLHEINHNYPGFGGEITAILQKAMAINARDRFASAWEFREALRQLGRNPRPAATSNSLRSASPANTVAMSNPMLPASVKTDPFDSYSILKPEQDVFRVRTPRRGPALVVVGFAIVLVTLASSLPAGLLKSLQQVFTSSRAAALTDATNAVSLRPARTESAVTKTATAHANQVPAVESSRPGDSAKKRSRRNQPKPPQSVKPPPFSITPEP